MSRISPRMQFFKVYFLIPLTILAVICSACNFPTPAHPTPSATSTAPAATATPLPTATATATARPHVDLPPALVEASPLPGSEIALNAPLVLSFNQPMDQASVESALQGQPSLNGKITWVDSSTLSITPGQPLQPATKLSLTVKASAKASNGLALIAPVTINYTTAEPLKLLQSLPADGTTDVTPASAVVATFDRPVVALGAEDTSNPPAFSLNPSATGRGEWINTSTYIFYPNPALAGGTSYLVQLNASLVSTDEAPLDASSTTSWSFETAMPKVDIVDPASPAPLRLDGPIVVSFNIAMDPTSVESNFSVTDASGKAVSGKVTWNDSHTSLSFKPDELFARAATYNILIKADTQAFGGAKLGSDYTTHLQTYPDLAVVNTDPAQGQMMTGYGNSFGTITLVFSAPLGTQSLIPFFSLSPAVGNFSPYGDPSTNQVSISGYYLPSTSYTLTISQGLSDAWGGSLGNDYQLTFTTPAAAPDLTIQSAQQGSPAVFLTPEDTGISAQATNLTQLQLTQAAITLKDFMQLLGDNGSNLMRSFTPSNAVAWTQNLSLPANRSQDMAVSVSPDGSSLPVGLYYLGIRSNELDLKSQGNVIPLLLSVSSAHLTFKMSADQALVWAVNLNTNTPISGGAVTVYDQNGSVLASGTTDSQGLFQASVTLNNTYQDFYAVMGKPGDQNFGLTMSGWSQGLLGYDFGITTEISGPFNKVYMYTDRPIYQPDQTVDFRAIVRKADNGRYSLPDFSTVGVKIFGEGNNSGQQILFDQTMPLTAYGTLSGKYTLPANAAPGYYQVQISTGTGDNDTSYLEFQVANYVKPEINLSVQLTPGEIDRGQPMTGKVNAQYFFGAPAGGVAVNWTLYRLDTNINLPQYQTGVLDTSWMSPYWMTQNFGSELGSAVTQGQDVTAADGTLTVNLPSDTLLLNAPDGSQRMTLEVTVQDENGQPVSQRASALMHPADFYIGLHPDALSSQAGSPLGFSILTVDWKSQPVGNKSLSAQFSKIEWIEQPTASIYDVPQYKAQTTPVASANPTTDASGQARLSFTPPDPGTYVLDVTGGNAHSQVLVWIAGPGSAAWPNLLYQQLHLTADASQYQPGESATVFIPNPLGANTQALVTLERGRVMSSQVITLSDAGFNLSIPLTDEDAPNVYLSVTLIGHTSDGKHPDYRQGYLNLEVVPSAQTLKVTATVNPQHATAGQQVSIALKVTDSKGQPVQGEFSIGVIDLAVLALANPNAQDILPAFYGDQPLGVQTSLSLNGYGGVPENQAVAGGRGGGGGGSPQSSVRENFQDTSYWNPSVVTGTDGSAQVDVTLPDNLTTWQVDVRGVTSDSQVGQATTQVITSKDLLVRPETPGFMVVGDHTALAAMVNNNTASDLQTDVSLQANGFTLDDPSQASQKVTVPANGHTSITWWGTAQDVPAVDLKFKASSGSLEDEARPTQGKLPVQHYSSPQTFSTAGVLTAAGNRLEVVSIPKSFTPTGGNLHVELSPSLAAGMVSSLKTLDNPDDNDTVAVLSSFLPNLETARALKDLGINAPDLQTNLDQRVNDAIATLLNHQNSDGGWIWWNFGSDPSAASDPYISAYVLLGLAQASQAGYSIPTNSIDQAKQFLTSALFTPKASDPPENLDRLAFINLALQTAGETDTTGTTANALYSVRNHLSPWAQAMVALELDTLSPGSAQAKTLISDLESSAIRSATGADWESTNPSWQNPGTPIFTTAVVLYTLAQKDPASSLLPDGLRYLMANRNVSNAWDSTYETAWVVMAMTEALKNNGDLQASFNYTSTLNGSSLASGQASAANGLTTTSTDTPLETLDPTYPNALQFNRDGGSGNLYYRADLEVDRPVESAPALSSGLSLERAYFLAGQDCSKVNCQPISEIQLASGVQTQIVTVSLTLTLPHDMYNLLVQDNVPAGMTIFNSNLLTSQQGLTGKSSGLPEIDPTNPFQNGWGWWVFNTPQIYTDHILWTAGYVPAGTYQLTYTLIPQTAGEFRVIPARAWEAFFPEVQGTTAGTIFAIKQ